MARAEHDAWQSRKDRAQSLIQYPAMELRRIDYEQAQLDERRRKAQAEYDRLARIVRAPLGHEDDVDPIAPGDRRMMAARRL